MIYILIMMALFSFDYSWCAAEEFSFDYSWRAAEEVAVENPSSENKGPIKRDDSWPSFERAEQGPGSWPALPGTPVGIEDDASIFAESAKPLDGMPTILGARKNLAALSAAAHRRSPTQTPRR